MKESKETILERVNHSVPLYILTYGIAISIAGIIIWPLLDLFWHNVVTHSAFVYTVNDYIIQPVIFGFVAAVVFCFFDFRKQRKSKKAN
ncbi:hypothetical protein IJ090_02820 [Candidatus Saccharibacteria bacterium]|nr:hypothetical protein [Candidatus Saccharibacteria bacterium]